MKEFFDPKFRNSHKTVEIVAGLGPYHQCPECGYPDITKTFHRCIDCGVNLKWIRRDER